MSANSTVEIGWSGLREEIRKAIMRPQERAYLIHGENFNPDVAGESADEVIAVLVATLTAQPVEVTRHPTIIGPASFEIDNGVER
jgi:hypothetical protein